MKSAMATRIPQGPGTKPGGSCTEFQLHKSQNPFTYHRNVFDYSEFRLKKYIDHVQDDQQKSTLESVFKDYISGRVAIAWKSGKPVWLKVTREKI